MDSTSEIHNIQAHYSDTIMETNSTFEIPNNETYDPNTIVGCLNRIAYLSQQKASSESKRYSFFPIKDKVGWTYYKKQLAAFWFAEEMEFHRDKEDYDKLSDKERKIIDYIYAFFSTADGIIAQNIAYRFLHEAITLEEMAFYSAQITIEMIHSEVYGQTIKTLIPNEEKREELYNAIENMPSIKRKDDWMKKYMLANISRQHRLVAFACAEGIFFTSAFLCIFWFRSRSILQNVIFSNEQISKDERLHRDAAIDFYLKYDKLLPIEEIIPIIKESVNIECEFIDDMLPEKVDDLDPNEMKDFVRHLGNDLLIYLGYNSHWNVDSDSLPTWMNDISMMQKSNFYEVRVGHYKQFSHDSSNINFSSEIFNNPDLDSIDF